MAGYQQKPSDIAIFKERDKRSDRAPDWKGSLVTPDGQKLNGALWFESDTMLAGKVEVPRDGDFRREEADRGRPDSMAGSGRDLDDDIPF